MKFLLFVGFVGLVWWIWSKRKRRPQQPPLEKPAATERMVVCQHCSVHLPESESIQAGSVFYCSEAHRSAGPKTGQ